MILPLTAFKVVITDYPDPELIENIKINVEKNIPQEMRSRVDVQVSILWPSLLAEWLVKIWHQGIQMGREPCRSIRCT